MDEIDHKLSSMSSVLRKLTLENLISRFKEEKISPDTSLHIFTKDQ